VVNAVGPAVSGAVGPVIDAVGSGIGTVQEFVYQPFSNNQEVSDQILD
jgi:hypothetical protein